MTGTSPPSRHDVLVVGGGVLGVCTAYFLTEAGRKVLLVDKEDICAGSSYGNAGLIVPSHSVPFAQPGVVWQALRWMFDPESPFYIRPRPELALLTGSGASGRRPTPATGTGPCRCSATSS